MTNIYVVSEKYCTEGWAGDAEYSTIPLAAFATLEEANTYIEKYEQPNLVYVTGWGSEFWSGVLVVDSIPLCRNEFPIPSFYDPEFQVFEIDKAEDESKKYITERKVI